MFLHFHNNLFKPVNMWPRHIEKDGFTPVRVKPLMYSLTRDCDISNVGNTYLIFSGSPLLFLPSLTLNLITTPVYCQQEMWTLIKSHCFGKWGLFKFKHKNTISIKHCGVFVQMIAERSERQSQCRGTLLVTKNTNNILIYWYKKITFVMSGSTGW